MTERQSLDPDVLPPRKFVTQAYGEWAPERMDLFHDVSAAEGFVVDGEALIIDAFSNWNVDWPAGCGQLLHVVYNVEKALEEFTCRGGIFVIAFFDCNRALWAMEPSKLLARDFIVRHLRSTLPKVVFCFKNWWSGNEWSNFLSAQLPSFILINDAEQLEHVVLPQGQSDSQRETVEEAKFLFRAFMVDCIVKRHQVVYTTRLVKKDNFMHGFVVCSSSARFLPMGKEIRIQDIYNECETLFGDSGSNAMVKEEKASYPYPGRFGQEAAKLSGFESLEGEPLRVRLAAAAVSAVLKGDAEFKSEGVDMKEDLAKAYILHSVILRHLPISSRSFVLTEERQEEDERSPYFAYCNEFFQAVTSEAAKLSSSFCGADCDKTAKNGDFSDVWDHRLVRKIIAMLLRADGKLEAPAGVLEEFKKAWKAASGADADLSKILTCLDGVVPELSEKPKSTFTLLPTEDTLVNQLVKDLDLPMCEESQAKAQYLSIDKRAGWLQRTQLWAAQDFEETFKSDDLYKAVQAAYADTYDTSNVSAAKKKKMEMRMERSRMKFIHSIQSGAESMSGGFLPSAPITATQQQDKSKDAKKKQGSKAAEIAAQNREVLMKKEKESQERAWSNFFSKLPTKKEATVQDLEKSADEINKLLNTSKKLKDINILTKARIERLKLLEREWVLICKETPELKEKKIMVAVDLFRGVHQLFNQYLDTINKFNKKQEEAKEEASSKKDKKDKKKKDDEEAATYQPLFGEDDMQALRGMLVMLGMKENCKKVDKKIAAAEGVEYSKDGRHKLPSSSHKSARVINSKSSDPNERSEVRFQMSRMGHLFERSVGEEDSRVVFKPDPWQKEMLDAVDRRESILCSAPTSAGKTFISYYCMKEVIFSSKEDVVVYVAPTRALCNQAAQDVYSIFSNKKYTESGWSLFGILGGGNYVQPLPPMGGPFMTQVLITIPSVFEHVMLSPKYQTWAKRVKYVIFDEVHCVDTSAEGHLWERLLMCTRAPFLALSATVGNFDTFKGWLEKTQGLIEKQNKDKGASEDRSYVVKGVFWNQRWNDLRKFIYLPRTVEARKNARVRVGENFGVRKVDGQLVKTEHIKPLHPFSTVTRVMLEKLKKFPEDLPLVPKESLELYDSMREAYEAVSHMRLGTWSDDDGNQIRFTEKGKSLKWRKGVHKDIVATLVEGDMPEIPADLQKSLGGKPEACYKADNGHIWFLFDDDNLQVATKIGDKSVATEVEHELAACVVDAMGDDGDGALSPEYYFRKDVAITQLRARTYESKLKEGFMQWVMRAEKDEDVCWMVDCVIRKLGGGLHDICKEAEQVAATQKCPLDTKEFLEQNVTDLLLCLNSEQLLPALVFNFDQSVCEDLAKKVVGQLEEAEAAHKETPEWKAFVKRLTDTMNQQKKQVKAFQAAKDNKRKDKEEGDGEGADMEEPELVDCSIPDILPQYAFCHTERGDGLKKEDLERLLKELENDFDRSHFLIRALERGIGVHHAGLPTKYRNNVEKLFRLKKLKVVIATDGLALGIHSPCRTVVLAGDDVKLSTMQFRQMSGRAGRRGQDFIGHVVFYGIPETKIVRLMTSGLPTLKGHMSIDTTTVLRMSLLHSFTSQAKGRDRIEVDQWRVKCMSECMMESLFTLGKDRCKGRDLNDKQAVELYKKMLRLQWRYTTDYLLREGLIQQNGSGGYLPGLTTRALYSNGEVHMSPPNLVFAALLKRGVFQKNSVCGQYTRKENAAIVAQFSKFLSTIFSVNSMGWKQEIHRCVNNNPDIASEDCPHEVILPPLSELFGGEIWKTLKTYTDETLAIFSELAVRMAEEAEKVHGKDISLPLSDVSFAAESFQAEGILKELAEQSLDVKARSPFVALCGLGDRFHCVEDLCYSLRSCIHIEEDSLPIIDYIDINRRDPEDRRVCINACCYDYVMEGPQTIDGNSTRLYLEELNGLTQSLSWTVLNKYFASVTNATDLVERLAPAYPKKDMLFTCCNTLCPPETKKFYPEKGLYKCHECDMAGIDTYMCPKCYEEGEECVTSQEGGKFIKNKSHVFFRHVYDRFVQTMSHITADLDPLNNELGRSQRTAAVRRKKKTYEDTNKKPKRPILQRPQRRGATLFVSRRRK